MTGGSTKEGLRLLRQVYTLENGWRYGGGHFKRVWPEPDAVYYDLVPTRHTRYFMNLCNEWGIDWEEYLENKKQKDNCICGHYIVENCFIYKIKNNGNPTIKVLGNCCINELDLNGRRCSLCFDKHKSRNHNYCSKCYKDFICGCGKKKSVRFPTCFLCKERLQGKRMGKNIF